MNRDFTLCFYCSLVALYRGWDNAEDGLSAKRVAQIEAGLAKLPKFTSRNDVGYSDANCDCCGQRNCGRNSLFRVTA